jgi:hypothetical protein
MSPHLVVHIAIGSVVVVLAVPLILRKVPMNSVYGVRIAKAFSSDRNWYEINAYGGKLLLGYGIFLIGYGVIGSSFAPEARSIWTLPYVIGPLLLAFPILALIVSYARRLP